jgi:hypothetical protein
MILMRYSVLTNTQQCVASETKREALRPLRENALRHRSTGGFLLTIRVLQLI